MSGMWKLTMKTHSGRTCKVSGEKSNRMTEWTIWTVPCADK